MRRCTCRRLHPRREASERVRRPLVHRIQGRDYRRCLSRTRGRAGAKSYHAYAPDAGWAIVGGSVGAVTGAFSPNSSYAYPYRGLKQPSNTVRSGPAAIRPSDRNAPVPNGSRHARHRTMFAHLGQLQPGRVGDQGSACCDSLGYTFGRMSLQRRAGPGWVIGRQR
jgi:hypothetical protein